MHSFLDEILTLLDSKTLIVNEDKDHQSVSGETSPAADGKWSILNLNIKETATEVLSLYIECLLSGEYCSQQLGHIDASHDSIRGILENLSQDIEQPEIQEYFYDNIVGAFDIVVPQYVNLVREINNQFELDRNRPLFRAIKDKPLAQFDSDVKDYIIAFDRTIKIIRIEHFSYQLNESTITQLLVYRREFEESKIEDTIRSAITFKIEFLLAKLLYRNETPAQEVSGNDDEKIINDFTYSFGSDVEEALDLTTIAQQPCFAQWRDIIEAHYGYSVIFKTLQRRRAKEILEDDVKNLTYSDYHALMKIHKDDQRNLSRANSLVQRFKQISRNTLNPFERFAYQITDSYLFNNNVSLKVDGVNFSPSLLNNKLLEMPAVAAKHLDGVLAKYEEIFEEIKSYQNSFLIYNYFPWQKIIASIDATIDGLLAGDSYDKTRYDYFDKLLKIYLESFRRFETCLKWSKSRNFIPFQLEFANCIVDHPIKTRKLFFFSSYVLPVNYSEVEKCYVGYQTKKVKYEALSTAYKKLRPVVEEVKEMQLKIRNQERRSIEVLAIFSSVALFSLGSIQIFDFVDVKSDRNLPFKFILAYGYSLALFVLLVWLVTRDDIRRITWMHWVMLLVLILSSVLVLIFFNVGGIIEDAMELLKHLKAAHP